MLVTTRHPDVDLVVDKGHVGSLTRKNEDTDHLALGIRVVFLGCWQRVLEF